MAQTEKKKITHKSRFFQREKKRDPKAMNKSQRPLGFLLDENYINQMMLNLFNQNDRRALNNAKDVARRIKDKTNKDIIHLSDFDGDDFETVQRGIGIIDSLKNAARYYQYDNNNDMNGNYENKRNGLKGNNFNGYNNNNGKSGG